MKSKHDKSSSDKYENKNGADEDDSQSDNGGRSRSISRIENAKNASTANALNDKLDHDALSIYIGNVDYSATEEELRNTFIDCGEIVRVTIIKNMKTGHPKGAAFIEFTDKEGVNAAMNLNGKQVKGRPLIVTSKKPRPENRQREQRPHYQYDRRPPPRSAPPMYSVYPSGGGGGMPRGGGGGYYHGGASNHFDNRRAGPSQVPTPMDQGHIQPRYDPYRRPEFYDPYMMQRGGGGGGHGPMPPQQYYHNSAKMGGGGGGGNNMNNHTRGTAQPPVRYSNPYNRR